MNIKDIAERVARSHGTGGWQTLEDMIIYAEALVAELAKENEQETAEACAKVCKALADCDENTEPYRQGASWCEEAIRSGAWKEYK